MLSVHKMCDLMLFCFVYMYVEWVEGSIHLLCTMALSLEFAYIVCILFGTIEYNRAFEMI